MHTPPPADRGPGPATGLALLLPITLSTMAIVLLAPVMPQMMIAFADVPGADVLVPIVLTVPALCIAIVSPLGGMAGDRIGRRRLLIAGLIVYAIVGVLPVFLTDIRAILASRVGVGIAEAFIMVASTTLIADTFAGRTRERWLAAQTAVASLSALLFFNVGGLLGQAGWRAPFWVYASALPMLLAVLAFTREPRRPAAGGETGGWAGFPWRPMLGICAVTVFGSILFYTVQIQAASGLAALGVTSPAQAGFLASVASLGVPLGTFVYGRLADVAMPRLLAGVFAAMGAGFAAMGAAGAPLPFLIGCAICQVSGGLLLPALLVWAMRQLRFAMRGRGTGLWQSCFAIGQFLSALVVSLLARMEGDVFGAFRWLGYAALLAAVIALVGARGRMASARGLA